MEATNYGNENTMVSGAWVRIGPTRSRIHRFGGRWISRASVGRVLLWGAQVVLLLLPAPVPASMDKTELQEQICDFWMDASCGGRYDCKAPGPPSHAEKRLFGLCERYRARYGALPPKCCQDLASYEARTCWAVNHVSPRAVCDSQWCAWQRCVNFPLTYDIPPPVCCKSVLMGEVPNNPTNGRPGDDVPKRFVGKFSTGAPASALQPTQR